MTRIPMRHDPKRPSVRQSQSRAIKTLEDKMSTLEGIVTLMLDDLDRIDKEASK